MALSIFNSEKRIQLTFAAAAILITILAAVNIAVYFDLAKGKDGTEAEKKFWKSKIISNQKYDMVFIGDSRTLCGINPALFDIAVGNRSYNGAFTGGGINRAIFEHVEKNLLDPAGTHRAVILGVTPMTMANTSRENGHFTGLKKELKKKENFLSEWLDIIFSDIRTKEIKELFSRRKPDKIYHNNGWLEKVSEVKPKARRSNLYGYRIYLGNMKLSELSMQEIAEKTAQWKKQNITVFAFRMPTFPEMDKLEDESGKYDIAQLKKRFQSVGVVWLEVHSRNKYNSYDGSHLERNDANKLSADLAEQIKAYFIK